MFKIISWTVSIILLTVGSSYAQDKKYETRIQEEIKKIDENVIKYRYSLKQELNVIWALEDANKITPQQAAFKKDSVANVYTEKIKNSVESSEYYISKEIRQRVDDIINSRDKKQALLIDHHGVRVETYNDSLQNKKGEYTTYEDSVYKKYKGEKRTTSQLVYAFGFNTLSEDLSFNKDFKTANSMFFEVGLSYKTRILKDASLLYFKYGFSAVADKLSATDNRIFVRDQNGIYNLENTGNNYSKNTFKNVSIIFPLHLEFDFTKKTYSPSLDKNFFKSQQSFRFGIGGFLGARTRTNFINKWEDDGKKYKEKYKQSYNINNFVYGVSAYAGYKNISLYFKYNLNSMFKNQPVDQNVFSIGTRFDFH